MWNCVCNAYNCNKLSKDVYLYQITLENGLKCLHKFRYKSFNIGSWSLHLLDSHNRSTLSKKRRNLNRKIMEEVFLVVQWQKVRVTIQLLWDGNDFQNLCNSYWIGLIMKWDFKILKLVVTCFPSLTCNSKSLVGLSLGHLHFIEWMCLRILNDPFMVICS